MVTCARLNVCAVYKVERVESNDRARRHRETQCVRTAAAAASRDDAGRGGRRGCQEHNKPTVDYLALSLSPRRHCYCTRLASSARPTRAGLKPVAQFPPTAVFRGHNKGYSLPANPLASRALPPFSWLFVFALSLSSSALGSLCWCAVRGPTATARDRRYAKWPSGCSTEKTLVNERAHVSRQRCCHRPQRSRQGGKGKKSSTTWVLRCCIMAVVSWHRNHTS